MKNIYKIILGLTSTAGALFAVSMFVATAHAQVVVNGLTDEVVSSCMVTSDNTSIQGITAGAPVSLMVGPDNTVYAIRGTYNVQINCGDLSAAQCNVINFAVNGAVSNSNAQPNFPQSVNGSSMNTLVISVGHYQGGACGGADICENNSELYPDGGGLSVRGTIYMDEDAPSAQDPSGGGFLVPSQTVNVIQSIITHEMGHAFGLSDTYAYSTEYPGLMGNALLTTYDNPNNPPLTWDPSAIAAIGAINTSNAITFNSTVNNCLGSTECSAGDVLGFAPDPNVDGYYTSSCLSPGATSAVSYCQCEGANPFCTDESGNVFSAPPEYCSNTGVGGFDCVNEACTYNPNGGSYSDFTSCSDACTASNENNSESE